MSELLIDRENHTYHLNQAKLDSVTDILSIFGAMDCVNPEILDRANIKGKAVHLATEYYDQGVLNEETLSDSIVPYLEGWKNFLKDTKFQIIDIEKTGYHKVHKYAYTVDRTGIYKGKLTIADIKSGTVNAKTTALQVAGYQEGVNSWIPKKSDKFVNRITVWLQPKFPRGYKVIEHKNKNDINTFLCVVNTYKWGKEMGYYGK